MNRYRLPCLALLLIPALCLLLTACGGSGGPDQAPGEGETPELHIFAASSMTESLDQVIALYREAEPGVRVIPTYDSSGTLLAQIQEGAVCDLFLSASPRQMDALEEAGELQEGARRDLLENRVVLAVPEGNPKGIDSFSHLAERLGEGEILLAVGNGDVPVGQYAQKIFAYYGLEEETLAAAGVLTYGSNVKEVTAQVREAAADCGIIYATDARSAGLTAVDSAGEAMCGRVLYPAAVLARSALPGQAGAFLDFLGSGGARAVFEDAGFTVLPIS